MTQGLAVLNSVNQIMMVTGHSVYESIYCGVVRYVDHVKCNGAGYRL